MRVLITGVCGFVGRWLAESLLDAAASAKSNDDFHALEVWGIDNLCRAGSESNRAPLQSRGVHFVHGDVRCESDFESVPKMDWILDCAAQVSVLSGIDSSPRQLIETNLIGTLNLLERCRRDRAGMILLSTSRVYSIDALKRIALREADHAYVVDKSNSIRGLTAAGVSEEFSTAPPTSLYAATKLASERMAHEYSLAFDFPLRINRCGVMAGVGQFGKIDQGINSFWIHSRARRSPLKYIGYGGSGLQVRDCLHPADLATLVIQQMRVGRDASRPVIVNVSGGQSSARSLFQLNRWCDERLGDQTIGAEHKERPFDVPWLVLDSSLAHSVWQWKPSRTIEQIWSELADEATGNPDWLKHAK